MASALEITGYAFLVLWVLSFIPTFTYTELVRRVFLGTDVSGPGAWAAPESTEDATGERVDFEATDGMPLTGTFVAAREAGDDALAAPRGQRRPAVVFSHPVGARGGAYAKYLDWAVDRGIHVFTFDHRGHGHSPHLDGYRPRQWVSEYEVADLLGALDHVRDRPEVDPERIALLGVSRGAGTSLIAASRRPFVCGVVCDSVFSTWHTLQERMRKWAPIFLRSKFLGRNVPWWVYMYLGSSTILLSEITQRVRYPSVVRALGKLRDRPKVFVHGAKDAYISHEQSCRFSRGYANGADSLFIVDQARHNDSVSVDPEGYRRFVGEFLGRVFEVPRG